MCRASLTDPSLSNYLTDLAARIKIEHEAAVAAARHSVEHAIAAGSLLIEAKERLKHGEWGPWLAQHCVIPDRTVRLYMQLARKQSELSKTATVADLTFRDALELLTAADREAQAEEGAPAPDTDEIDDDYLEYLVYCEVMEIRERFDEEYRQTAGPKSRGRRRIFARERYDVAVERKVALEEKLSQLDYSSIEYGVTLAKMIRESQMMVACIVIGGIRGQIST